MNISIKKPYLINETGRWIKNKDSIYPDNEPVNINNRFFLVCDGVGKTNKGEVASSLACDAVYTYFNTFLNPEEKFNPLFIEKALQYAEVQFDEYIKKDPYTKGMATMLCLLYFAPDGVYLTHAGNSRIYQFRDGKIIFKTEDNSIQVSHAPVKIDITKITDVLPDDEFFMCTDGVTEVWSDEDLCKIFSTQLSSETRMNTIKEFCRESSKDNYSAYLIPIHDVNKVNTFKQMLLYAITYFNLLLMIPALG